MSKRVKDTVLDDGWWERVDLTIKIMNPIISFLRFADMDQPILGEVYEGWDSVHDPGEAESALLPKQTVRGPQARLRSAR
jgi:hypothetical protein